MGSEESDMVLPNDLLLEILTRLGSKELDRCKCVCKSWRSIIGSSLFLEAYCGRHRPGLLLNVPQKVDPKLPGGGDNLQISFFHSNLSTYRLKNPKEKFSCLNELGTNESSHFMTEVVNGLACVFNSSSSSMEFTLCNICTGEDMRLPVSPSRYTRFLFRLGHDRTNREYKLLKLEISNVCHLKNAEIMTLRPSASLCTWRELELEDCASGLDNLSRMIEAAHITRTFSSNWVLYWLWWNSKHGKEEVLSFDFSKERFRAIKLPEDEPYLQYKGAWDLAESMGRLALWVIPNIANIFIENYFVLLVLEDEEGNRWSKHYIELPLELDGISGIYTTVVGNLPTGQMLLMNPTVEDYGKDNYIFTPVFSYDHHTNKFERFLVGNLPPMICDTQDTPFLHRRNTFFDSFREIVSCLFDNRNLNLPLEKVLGGTNRT